MTTGSNTPADTLPENKTVVFMIKALKNKGLKSAIQINSIKKDFSLEIESQVEEAAPGLTHLLPSWMPLRAVVPSRLTNSCKLLSVREERRNF